MLPNIINCGTKLTSRYSTTKAPTPQWFASFLLKNDFSRLKEGDLTNAPRLEVVKVLLLARKVATHRCSRDTLSCLQKAELSTGNDVYFFIFIWFYLLKLILRCVFIAQFFARGERSALLDSQHIAIIATY